MMVLPIFSTEESWLLSDSTCTGPDPNQLSEGQSIALERLIFILFSPCTQHILQAACHVFFFLTLAISHSPAAVYRLRALIRFSPFPDSHSIGKFYKHSEAAPSPGSLFFFTISILSLYSLLAFLALGFHIWLSLSRSSDLYQVLFSALRALVWTSFTVIAGHEIPYRITRRSRVLRAWWFFNSVLAVFQFISSVIRFASYGFSTYSYSLAIDDIFTVTAFPACIFLLVLACWGPTGIKLQPRQGSSYGLTESLLNESQNQSSDEDPVTGFHSAGLYSQCFWLWLNPLLSKGATSTLQVHDVPELSPDDRADKLYSKFLSNWPKEGTKHPVAVGLFRTFKSQLLLTACIALVKVFAMYAGPLMIQSFVAFLETKPRYYIEGYMLVFILFLAKFVEVLSTHQYQFLSQKLGMTIRSCLITSIYRKGLQLSSASRQSHGAGTIVNYMSVDVQNINDSIVQIHNTWMLPLQTTLALIVLYQTVGLPMLAGFGTLLLLAVFISNNVRIVRRSVVQVMAKKDIRMKATTEFLTYMKNIKLQAWEEYFLKKVETCRNAEYQCLRKLQTHIVGNMLALGISTSAVSLVTFATCLLLNTDLTAAKVFTVISTFNILAEPIRSFPQAIVSLGQASASLGRIDRYMLSNELVNSVYRCPIHVSEYSVVVEDGEFTWDAEATVPSLHGINLRIPQGHFVAIVGTVGGGKSSLLSALLGEMPKLSGHVQVYGTTAYVPQTAWIQSGTLEENILFGMPMQSSKYKSAIKGCNLEPDIALLEFGDQTEIGERGINLSGGQKQRVQLARAVYQDCDVYFLDDIFSAVDAHTGSAIFKDCIMGTLKTKTRILVTHQVEFLHKADLILVMHDGIIKETGKYADLIKLGAELGALVAAHEKAIGLVDDLKPDEELEEIIETYDNGVKLTRSISHSSVFSQSRDNLLSRRSSETLSSPATEPAGKLVQEEKREIGKVRWSVYWLYLTSAYGIFYIFVVLAAQAAARTFNIAADFWLSNEMSQANFDATLFIRVYALLCAGSWAFIFVRAILLRAFTLKTTQTFFLSMLRSIFRAPMSFFDSTPTGRILTRSSTDQATLDITLPLSYSLSMAMYTSAIGAVVVTIMVTWPLAFIVIPLGWIYFKYQAFYIKSSREISRLDSVTKAPVIHHFTETIAGFMVIRGFGKQQQFITTNQSRVNTNLKMNFHFNASNDWLGFRLEIIGATVLCSAAFFLIILPQDLISPSMAALSLSYGLSLNTMLAASVFYSCTVENKMVSVERIGQYINLPSEAPLVIEGSIPYEDWPHKGDISIRSLKARYQPTMPLVLKGITLDIVGGQKIGVVGRTGSGKSTLVQVLFRIVEPASGIILFDNVDICSLGLHDLRSRLGIIPQDPVLFEGTIRTNMDPLGTHTDEEIWMGLEKCQLADVVRSRDNKLDAIVADNAENWSVGQRQILCLGRALLKRSRILFLDEATASVDTQTDALLQKIIREEFQSSTVISIAHRIPTVLDSDKVMVLEAGYLKEYDAPGKLLEDPSTLFSALVMEYTTRTNG